MTAPLVRAPRKPGFQIITKDNPAKSKAMVLYLGPPKYGKSLLMGSWPNPMFIVFPRENLETVVSAGHPYIVVDNSAIFEREVMPYLIEGGLAADHPEVESICFDSISFMAVMRSHDVMSSGEAPGDEAGYVLNAKEGDWDQINNWLMRQLGQMTRLARSTSLPKNYYVLASCHERDRYAPVLGPGGKPTWEQKLVGIEPALPGRQVGPLLSGFFDVTLYVDRSMEAIEKPGPNGTKVIERVPRYVCHASEPPLHKAPAGGSLWGCSKLPPTLDGSYQGLRKACGLQDEVKV